MQTCKNCKHANSSLPDILNDICLECIRNIMVNGFKDNYEIRLEDDQ